MNKNTKLVVLFVIVVFIIFALVAFNKNSIKTVTQSIKPLVVKIESSDIKLETSSLIKEVLPTEVKKVEEEVNLEHLTDPIDAEAFKSENWDMVLKNGVLVSERYAIVNNPSANFSSKSGAETSYQTEGKYKGRYLLNVTHKDSKTKSTSYAQLRPLFSMNSNTEELELATPQWVVITANLDGVNF